MIYLIIILAVLVLLLTGILIYRQVTSQVEKELQSFVSQLKATDLESGHFPKFDKGAFDALHGLATQMNEFLNDFEKKYTSRKQFTENVTHELQNPLAVIQSKAEILLQSNLGKDELKGVSSILMAVERLNKINKGLILLSKINNARIDDIEEIDVEILLLEYLSEFNQQLEFRKIEVVNELSGSLTAVRTSVSLIDIVIVNLVKNAIRHNISGGFIALSSTDNTLLITNSGPELEGNPYDMFERFSRYTLHEESIGLGLSIVKRACEVLGLEVSYSTEKKDGYMQHFLQVKFF